MRRSMCLLFVAAIAVTFLYTGCSKIVQKSPSEVVQAAYMAANEGKYSETEKYLSSDALKVIKGEMGAMAGGLKGMWDHNTRNGTIERIEILKEEIRGEGATVKFKIYFKGRQNPKTLFSFGDENPKEDDEELIKEDGVWKITAGK